MRGYAPPRTTATDSAESSRVVTPLLRRVFLLQPLALTVAMLCAPVVWAQAPQPEPSFSQPVAPPRPLQPLDVPYPPGAEGEAAVVLTLVVNADGTVRGAAAEGERSVFSDAAEAAAKAWRFEPATREGKNVPARIRAKILFRPPTGAPPPAGATPTPTPTAQPGSPAPAARASVTPIEVTVQGELPPAHATSLSRTEVRLMPGAFGDPFRALEALPGVTPIATGVPFFYVRGAPPGNVGYFLDDVRVPVLYHVALGPSVIHPELVERVDLYRGGYPASYGRFAGGIVAGETRPPSEELRAYANIRLVDAGALLEVPFAGGRGNALASGRYSYTAAVLSLIAPGVSLDYWDYQSRLSYRLTPHDEVSAFVFGSYDYLGNRLTDGTVSTIFSTQFHRADLRYDHRIGSRIHLRSAVTLGIDVSDLELGNYLVSRSLRGRAELIYRADKRSELRLGADVGVNHNEIDVTGRERNIRSLFPGRYDSFAGAHADLVLRAVPEMELTPGVRLDLYGSAGAAALSLEPRLAGRFFVGKRARIVHAYGFSAQPPAFVIPVPGLDIGALRGGLQRSFQASAGVELDLPEDIQATITGFRSVFWNLTDGLSIRPPREGEPIEAFLANIDTRTTGTAFGLEVFLRRSFTRALAGYISYTLSRSIRTLDGTTFASAFDRTHVLSGAVTYDIGRGFRAGARAVFYTGGPRQGYDSIVPLDDDSGTDNEGGEPAKAPERLPPFFRLDLRLEKRWQIGKTGWLSVVLEGLNATAAKEVFAIDCDPSGCASQELGPVTIPSFGVEGGF
jgi:TonB family protein